MAIPYTKTATSISLVINFTSTVIPSSHPNFAQIVKLVANPKTTESQLKPLLDIPKAIETFTGGNVTVIASRLYYKGFEVKGELAKVILDFVKSGQPDAAKPFELFLEKAFQNPDPRASQDLYSWVAASGLPITPQGDILAWKAVGNDYFSIHSGPRGKLRHKIGDVVTEPRHETDADPTRTCSRGLHFCSADYLKRYASGGSRVMAVTISPTDVVAFPKDYGNAKGRACQLTVVGEVPHDQVNTFYPQGQKIYKSWISDNTIRVGDKWTTRGGNVVEIVGEGTCATYPFRDKNGTVYTKTGRYVGDNTIHTNDLISRV